LITGLPFSGVIFYGISEKAVYAEISTAAQFFSSGAAESFPDYKISPSGYVRY
jgi:hypothetical protein